MKKTEQQPMGVTAVNQSPSITDRPDTVYHDVERKQNRAMRWYQEWQQDARSRYLAGYYPGHERVPNCIVRGLYWIGHFFADFVPLVLNLINGIYMTIKRLLAFIAGLIIEASTVIVLIGTIAFSVVHSIELLRRAGATGGLEYIGVLMFEVVFVSSTAALTGMLMSGQRGIHKTAGFGFCGAGFLVGIGFVFWSNVSAMAPSWEGWIIGIMTPILLIISEGILAYRYMDAVKGTAQDTTGNIPAHLLQWLKDKNVSFEEIKLAVEAIRKERPDIEVGLPSDLVQIMKEHNVSTDELKQQVQGYSTQEGKEGVAQNETAQEEITQMGDKETPQVSDEKTTQVGDKQAVQAGNEGTAHALEETTQAGDGQKDTTQINDDSPKQKADKKKTEKTEKIPTDINEKRKKVYDEAVKIWKEEGKRPGRDTIMKRANCGSSVAKAVIDMLKENREEIEKEIVKERGEAEKEKAESVS